MALTRRAFAMSCGGFLGFLTRSDAAIAADRFPEIRRIGVIAALGDTVEIAHFGYIAPNRRYTYLPVKTWDLDGFAARKAGELLGGRFEIAQVPYDEASFLPPPDAKPDDRDPRLGPLIATMSKSVDAYLVIRKISWNGPGWVLAGLGVEHSKMSFLSTHGMVHVSLEISLVEAGTGKIIASKSHGVPLTAAEAPGEWADSADQLTTEQQQKLRGHIEALVAKEIERSLPAMGLATT
jgi:hypothetical protein